MNTFGHFSVQKIISKTNQKKMEKVKLNNIEKLEIKRIDNTPFNLATNGDESYLMCGKVIMKLDDNDKIEEATNMVKEKAWSTIALLIQSMFNELVNNK